jgi:hypothetical protein
MKFIINIINIINIIFIVLLFPVLLFAQQQPLNLVQTIPGDFSLFSADNLGNVYLLQKNDQFKKRNPQGDSMGVFNDVRRFGKVSSINTSNPLRTIVFYKDYRNIVMLDRFFSVVNVIDLRKQNLFQVSAIGNSFDNNLWIFDEQESKLKKIGEDGKKIMETSDLRVGLGEAITPSYLADQNGFVYVYDPKKGMFVFDYYGALKTKIALLDWKDVQVIGNSIFGRKDNSLVYYETGSLQLKTIILPKEIQESTKMIVTPGYLFFLTQQGILKFTLSNYE